MIGFIGGSGVYDLPGLQACEQQVVQTDYGDVDVLRARLNGVDLAIIYRHGSNHNVPPHAVNYRANIAALSQLGVTHILASNAVGGIHAKAGPGTFIIPDQIIDYTWGREHTFFDHFNRSDGVATAITNPDEGLLKHVDFTEPLDSVLSLSLQRCLQAYAAEQKIEMMVGGVYGCTQGPRLETAAEIQRLKRDGCDIVGMTMMPEAALAREKSMRYASVCFSVNWAAGIQAQAASDADSVNQNAGLPVLSMDEIRQQIEKSTAVIKNVVAEVLGSF